MGGVGAIAPGVSRPPSLSSNRWKAEPGQRVLQPHAAELNRGQTWPPEEQAGVTPGWPVTTLAALGFLAWSGVKDGRRQPLAAVWALPVTSPALADGAQGCDVSLLCTHVTSVSVSACWVCSQEPPPGLDSAATRYFSPLLGERTVVPIIQEITSLDGWATSQWPASRCVLSP